MIKTGKKHTLSPNDYTIDFDKAAVVLLDRFKPIVLLHCWPITARSS